MDAPSFAAAEFLPAQTRPYLHALFVFAKVSDDIADETGAQEGDGRFSDWCAATLEDLSTGTSAHRLRRALLHTVDAWGLDVGLIEEFLLATSVDTSRRGGLATFGDLRDHLRGVSGTIAVLTLPLLEPTGPRQLAEQMMSLLGEVTQFIDIFRDFPVELPRGRCYLPLEDLERFDVSVEDLVSRRPIPEVDALLDFQLGRARRMLDESMALVSLVHPANRPFLDVVVTGLHAYMDEFRGRKSEVLWARGAAPTSDLAVSGRTDGGCSGATARASSGAGRAYLAASPHPSGARPPHFSAATLPHHVAVIMDGNRRWATARGRPCSAGFSAGWLAAMELLDGALEIGIANLSVFIFSTENWSRPADEIAGLFDVLISAIQRDLQRVREQGVQLRWSGLRNRVPAVLRDEVESAERCTRGNDKLTLNLCLDYGGRTEILDATRRLALDAVAGLVDPVEASERTFRRYMYEPSLPDVDLLIRTSPERRISNFMLWQAAFAELVFDDVLWPDFDRRNLWRAIEEFMGRDRRFGGSGTSVSAAPIVRTGVRTSFQGRHGELASDPTSQLEGEPGNDVKGHPRLSAVSGTALRH